MPMIMSTSLLCLATGPLLSHGSPLMTSFKRRQEQQTQGSWKVSGQKDSKIAALVAWKDIVFVSLESQITVANYGLNIAGITLSADAESAPDSTSLWQTPTPYPRREDRQVFMPLKMVIRNFATVKPASSGRAVIDSTSVFSRQSR